MGSGAAGASMIDGKPVAYSLSFPVFISKVKVWRKVVPRCVFSEA